MVLRSKLKSYDAKSHGNKNCGDPNKVTKFNPFQVSLTGYFITLRSRSRINSKRWFFFFNPGDGIAKVNELTVCENILSSQLLTDHFL